MSAEQSIVLAALALVALTMTVVTALWFVRMREMRAKHLRPQQVSDSRGMAQHLENVQVADNFRNLFETPVLFYAWCALVLATGTASAGLAAGAWAYVVLRVMHSAVHCTYNRVLHRTAVYSLSLVVLGLLWVTFVLRYV